MGRIGVATTSESRETVSAVTERAKWRSRREVRKRVLCGWSVGSWVAAGALGCWRRRRWVTGVKPSVSTRGTGATLGNLTINRSGTLGAETAMAAGGAVPGAKVTAGTGTGGLGGAGTAASWGAGGGRAMARSGATASRAGKPGGTGGVASASRPWYGGAVVDEKMSASCRRAACWWSASGESAKGQRQAKGAAAHG